MLLYTHIIHVYIILCTCTDKLTNVIPTMTPKIIIAYKGNKTRVGYNFVSFLDLTLNEAKGVGTLSHLL